MIREIAHKLWNKILVKRNIWWSNKHCDELNKKYNGKMLLIVDCEVVAVGSFLSDMPHNNEPGALYCQTKIVDPYRYFDFSKKTSKP